MLFYTSGQAEIFLAMVYAGVVFGVWYDVLKIIRNMMGAGPYLTAFIDAMFALGCAMIFVFFLYRANYLDLRLYAAVGALSGLTLYMLTVSPLLRFVLRWLTRIAAAGAKRFANLTIVQKIFK